MKTVKFKQSQNRSIYSFNTYKYKTPSVVTYLLS